MEFGPAAIQLILPDWMPPHLDEARTFLERMAEAAHPVPLVLYNPPHAKTVLRPEDCFGLARFLAGVKVGLGDIPWFALCAATRKGSRSCARTSAGHRLFTWRRGHLF